MRRFVFALLLVAGVSAQAAAPAFPPLAGRVVDQADILTAATEQDISTKLEAHERATGHQLVVATVASLEGRDIAEYGVELGRAWAIGQKEKDTGAILIVAPNDRDVRIEVGYGLEGILTDARARGIIESNILPSFRAGQMEAGVAAGVDAILGVLRGDPEAAPTAAPEAAREQDPREYIGLIIAFLIIAWLRRGRRRRGLWPVVLGGPTIWHSGSRRGGGFGGGGFRGGGGSFGGGGASGRW